MTWATRAAGGDIGAWVGGPRDPIYVGVRWITRCCAFLMRERSVDETRGAGKIPRGGDRLGQGGSLKEMEHYIPLARR
jgi:hypothetical protein